MRRERRWCGVVVSAAVSVVALSQPAAAAPASLVATGFRHSCAITAGGALWCWGYNESGALGDGTVANRPTPVTVASLGTGVTGVAAGGHTCAVTAAGAAWCWGSNGYGQVGDGTYTQRTTPTAVTGLGSGVAAVAAGYLHSCALTSAGAVRCWGYNGYGQLGDGTTTNSATPVAVSSLSSGVAAIAAGDQHSCALTSAGAVLCWGANSQGQLGDGTTTGRSTPVAVSSLGSDVSVITAGSYHTCALTNGGALWCWGGNYSGQVGDGTTDTRLTPVAVSGLGSGVVKVSAGAYSTCALLSGGGLRCWGANESGQLGDGTRTTRRTPTAVIGLDSGVALVSGGTSHACAVRETGSVSCWGANGYGQLGDAVATHRPTPVAVAGLAGATAGASGGFHTCAITGAGALSCWGRNGSGQLGDGTYTTRSAPVTVSGLGSGVLAAAGGLSHTCSVTSAGAAWCWGYNTSGQLGDGTTVTRSTPVAVTGLGSGVSAVTAGNAHSCAIVGAGAAWCWGYNGNGQLGDGTTTQRTSPVAVGGLASGVAFLSAGASHTCAVTTGGAALCWGGNSSGQLGDGTTTSRSTPTAVSGLGSGVAAIAAGNTHTCAVTAAGALLCWGNNALGQLGDGTTTSRLTPAAVSGLGSGVSAVSTSYRFTCASTSTGSALCWGRNDFGQVGDGTTTNRLTPTAVSGLGSGVAAVGTGYDHACALTATGGASCWGTNTDGQLGDGRMMERLTAVSTAGLQPATSDVGRDGRSDVLWHHSTGGDVWEWPMNGTTPLSQTHLATVADTDWQIYGLGDQTGDGRADLLWRHETSGALFLWTMNGTTLTARTYLGAVVLDYGIVGAADYTGDGKSDILWRHQATGDLWLWRMNGATLDAVTWVATIAPEYAIVASGDLNGDGKADLLWHNQSTGAVWAWLMNGAVATSQVYLGAVAALDYRVAGLGDVDRDGRADVLWYHVTSGDVWVWTMDGTTIAGITHVATVGDPNFRVVGTGDYDGDGKADVLWHHATTGALWVWLMDGAAITSATWVATIPDVGYQVVTPR